MKKTKIFSAAIAGVLATSAMTIPAHAMGLGNGVKASVSYTYAANDEGVANVLAKDKNETLNKTVNLNETVTSKTGTITWADGYENVTAFYIDAKPGFAVTKVTVDGNKTGQLYAANEDLTVNVNSTLGNDGTYSMPAMSDYDNVFYFLSAGNEAWVKNHTFAISTEAIEYTFVKKENGEVLGKGKITDESINIDLSSFNKPGHTTNRYTVNGIDWDGHSQITAEMVEKSENNQLVVEAKPTVNSYNITIKYYNDRVSGEPYQTVTKKFDYNAKLNKDTLGLEENEFIVGSNEYSVPNEDSTLSVVRHNNNFAKNEWAFTYTGEADKHIKSVTAQWNYDKKTDTTIQLNETVKLTTDLSQSKYHVKFFVAVDKDYALTGSNKSNKEFVVKLTDDTNSDCDVYEIEYTRKSHHSFDPSPVHEYFSLETSEK